MVRESRRLAVVATVVAVFVGLFVPAGAVEKPSKPIDDGTAVPWDRPTSSLSQRPADIVGTAAAGRPLRVEITRASAHGPVFESVAAASPAAAEAIVARAQRGAGVIAVGMEQVWRAQVASYDPYRKYQWGLTTLKAESVWNYGGGGALRVAVVDTGVSSAHPDLKGHVVPGYNSILNSTAASTQDGNGHGTHVAGIIGALLNNAAGGVAGFAPNSRIVPVKALGDSGAGTTTDVAEGITWAANNYVRVINLSMAGTASSSSVASAINYARTIGVVVVAAAGNSGCSLFGVPEYPAAYPGVVGVAATEQTNAAASYSDCGNWVDIAAPGSSILSTMPSAAIAGCGGAYCYASGTSMSAAYVSAAAIITAQRKGLKGDGLVNRLLGTATELGPYGWDSSYGYGLLNPLAAVQ